MAVAMLASTLAPFAAFPLKPAQPLFFTPQPFLALASFSELRPAPQLALLALGLALLGAGGCLLAEEPAQEPAFLAGEPLEGAAAALAALPPSSSRVAP